jgi:hypothetical protein
MTDTKKMSPVEELLGEELLRAIGLLIVTAGSTEHGLALQFARLIAHPNKIDPATVAALGRTETRAQLQQIKISTRFRLNTEKAQELIKLCDRIQDSFDRRNEIAHSIITPGTDADKAVLRTIKIKADGSLVPAKPYTAKQIREFAQKLFEHVAEFDHLLTASGLKKLDPDDFIQTEGQENKRL